MKDLAAALLFFTRLPLWRLKAFHVPAEHFKQAIYFWPVTGWLTAGIMAGVLWLSAQVVPYSIAVILALLSRIILTGALHEDGLADFCDGFGGGTTKDKILSIMKDSHIGTYGVIGLIFYFILAGSLLYSLALPVACVTILIADPLCKFIASQMTRFLPYSRTEETSKAKVVYSEINLRTFLPGCIFGLLPLVFIPQAGWLLALLFPILLFIVLITLMKRKIQGYTGDCCGALFLLCELSFYLGIVILSIHLPL